MDWFRKNWIKFFKHYSKLGKVVYAFFGDLFTNIFNAIYNQQIDPKKARNVIIGFFVIVFATSITISAVNYFGDGEAIKKVEVKKPEVKKRS